jgi:hypothetical protein
MRKIAGPGHVSNEWADYDANTNPLGTVFTAAWGNDVQDELVGIQAEMGIAEAAGTNKYVLASIIGLAKSFGKEVGELFFLPDEKAVAAFDKDDPDAFFPAVRLDDATKTLAEANYPLLVPFLRGLKAKAGGVTDFSVTVSGSDVEFPNNAAGLAMIAALVEDEAFHGSFTDYRSININGTDYPIAGYTPASRIVTVTGTPTTGAQTGIIYPYRISGSTTTARLCKADGIVLASDNTTERVSGLRTRDRLQNLTGAVDVQSNVGINRPASGGTVSGAFKNGASRTGFHTDVGTGATYVLEFDASGSPSARTGTRTSHRNRLMRVYKRTA